VAFRLNAKQYSGSGRLLGAMADWHRGCTTTLLRPVRGPANYGGQDLAPVYDVIVDEELVCGLLEAAAAAQRGLPGLRTRPARRRRTAETLSCPASSMESERVGGQGFSETGAGSICIVTPRTSEGRHNSGERHKIWTVLDVADWLSAAGQSDPEAQATRGLSAFVLEMKQAWRCNSDAAHDERVTNEFGQVFSEGATVARTGWSGAPGEGWAVASMTVSDRARTVHRSSFSFLATRPDTQARRSLFAHWDDREGPVPRLAWAGGRVEIADASRPAGAVSEQLDGWCRTGQRDRSTSADEWSSSPSGTRLAVPEPARDPT